MTGQLLKGYNYTLRFYEGIWVQITGYGNKSFKVNISSDDIEISENITSNNEIHIPLLYYQNWNIEIWDETTLLLNHNFNLNKKDVLIVFVSNAIGDTIAWIPYVEEFRKKHDCNVYCVTFYNNLFNTSYPDIHFIDGYHTTNKMGYFKDMFSKMGKEPYVIYQIGWFVYQQQMNIGKNKVGINIPNNPFNIPLQKAASDGLGLTPYKEIKPLITPSKKPSTHKKPYITISEYASNYGRNKMWTYPYGWQMVVDWLVETGYDVVVISKESTKLKNIINLTGGDYSLKDRVHQIQHSEMFIGVSSGLAWLAWG
jgi:autotransporter strand-loop-strand O-heptosyltransferase